MTCGVPQGSIIGLTLWNIVYDGVLSLQLGPGIIPVAYADDLALIVKAPNADELNRRGSEALRRVTHWLEARGLEIAPRSAKQSC